MSSLTLLPLSSLPDMRMSPSIGTASPGGGPQGAGNDFGSILKGFMGEAADTLKQGEAAAVSGIQGGMPVQAVVERVMAAERTLQTGIGIRDKLVGSYLEISRMQI